MFKVESDFIFNGLRCVVTFGESYTRCGYVGIPKEHKLFGEDFELTNKKVDVYSGLSYSSKSEDNDNYPINSELWWFGFACNNLMDGADTKAALEYFPEMKEEIKYFIKRRETRTKLPIKTKEFIEDECRKLAVQIAIL